MGEVISTRTHPLDSQIKLKNNMVIKPNYSSLSLALIPSWGPKVIRGIISNASFSVVYADNT